jgi:hypothetical protein
VRPPLHLACALGAALLEALLFGALRATYLGAYGPGAGLSTDAALTAGYVLLAATALVAGPLAIAGAYLVVERSSPFAATLLVAFVSLPSILWACTCGYAVLVLRALV